MTTEALSQLEREAQGVVIARLQAMSPEEKLHASLRLYYSAWALKAAWLRSNNPKSSEEEIQKMTKESFMYART